jgi:hypothetical protein
MRATGRVEIVCSHGSDAERYAALELGKVLATYDVSRYRFTDLVTVDDDVVGGHSHPLTINPRLLTADADTTLRVYLHEQLHWFVNTVPGMGAAISEARERWPDPPALDQGGATDAWSAWLHFLVCSLEYAALRGFVGDERARASIARSWGYQSIYQLILEDWDWFDGFLTRHGLVVGDAVPDAQRWGTPGQVVDLGAGRPTLTLVKGDPRERLVAELLERAYGEHRLERWQWTDVADVNGFSRPSAFPVLTLNCRLADNPDALLALWLELQLAWWLRDLESQIPHQAMRRALGVHADELDDSDLRYVVIQVNALRVLQTTIGRDRLEGAIAPSFNADGYRLVQHHLAPLVTSLGSRNLLADC